MSKFSEDRVQPTDNQKNASPILDGSDLMKWMIKAHPYPTLPLDIVMALVTLIPVGFLVYSYFGEFANGAEVFFRGIGFPGIALCLLLWIKGARQKTVFRYRITDIGAEVEHWEDYPEHMGSFFKWLSGITLFIVVCLIAVEPAFAWGLVGPVGIALGGAKYFLGWENEKHHRLSSPWSEYNFVTVDRKRKMLVTHRTDLRVGFEIHFSKILFDEGLATLHRVLPPTAVFTEAKWKG